MTIRRIGRTPCAIRTATTGRFGCRFLGDEARDAGELRVQRTAWRICSANGWFSRCGNKPRRGKPTKVGPPIHDDLVERDFTADAPNELWPGDITEHRTLEVERYVCVITDVSSNRIVGYSTGHRMKASIAVNAPNHAAARRGAVVGCVLHTDRSSQLRSRKHARALARNCMVRSMCGGPGDARTCRSPR